MVIYAPYPFVLGVVVLPDPLLENQEQLQDERDYRISMDKTVYSYVKTTTKKLYVYSFRMNRQQFDLFEAFVQAYHAEQWRIIDHHSVERIGYLMNNPITGQFYGLHTGDCEDGYSHNERATVEIEFEA